MKEKTELQDVLSELGKELQDTKAHVGEGKKTSLDLETQLEVQMKMPRKSWSTFSFEAISSKNNNNNIH